ncbi:hypothetical protein VaNZ11_011271 [Volvox africanus]|uniref:N-acetyltransferase domain-containing protein n=1 Tax=Volvox africanus TaxID=51714 RepID=A0ABQ5SBP9_9CHLO|nr:hypothetical protein VaNZ11_011271 [Volvox africanus]
MQRQRLGHKLNEPFIKTCHKKSQFPQTLPLHLINRKTVPVTLIPFASLRPQIAAHLPNHEHQSPLLYRHPHLRWRFVSLVAVSSTSRSEEDPLPMPAVEALSSPSLKLSLHIFCPEDEPEVVAQCCDTIGQGFAAEPNTGFFSPDPSRFAARWRAIAQNTLLRSRGVPLVHCLIVNSLNLGLGPGLGQGEGPELRGQEQGEEGQERVAAVALAYSYPDQKVPDDALPPGLIDLSETSRPEAMPVRDDLLSYMSTKKTEFLNTHGSFEYVAFLATRPEYWGRGLGSHLLRYLTDKADAAGRWCYLEATNPDNARLYERHGFLVLETKTWTLETLPGHRAMLILMARPPASKA